MFPVQQQNQKMIAVGSFSLFPPITAIMRERMDGNLFWQTQTHMSAGHALRTFKKFPLPQKSENSFLPSYHLTHGRLSIRFLLT